MTEAKQLCDAVDRFAAKMKAKLLEKQDQGWSGWREKHFIVTGQCEWSMTQHFIEFVKGDMDQLVDIANFAMFIDNYYTKQARKERE
jgi:hypothetical protein